MKTYDYVLLVLTVLILVAVRAGAPHTSATANGTWAPYGIDLSALTRNAGRLPEEEFPAH